MRGIKASRSERVKHTLALLAWTSLLIGFLACRSTVSELASVSDPVITTRIAEKLAADPDIDMEEISVETTNGIVTLTGRVEERQAKVRAGIIARTTWGVVSVENLLEIAHGESAERRGDLSPATL